MWPLLSPKPFTEFTPQEFRDYVISLHKAPPKKRDFTVRLNKKGTIVLRINREPKFLLRSEVDEMARELGLSLQLTWSEVAKRKIEVRNESTK